MHERVFKALQKHQALAHDVKFTIDLLSHPDVREGATRLDIWVANATGGDPRRLTHLGTAQRPTWCEGGSVIVFHAEGANGRELWRVPAAGGDPELLPPPKYASNADCSRTSEMIAFERYVGANVVEIALLSLRDRSVRDFTTFGKRSGSPRWSPDGKRIAFVSNKDGPQDLYVKDVATGEVVRLTNSEDIESRATWTPNGSMIVYGASNNTRDIWILDVEASTRQLAGR